MAAVYPAQKRSGDAPADADPLNPRFGEPFANLPAEQQFIIRLITAAGYEPFDGGEEFHPIFEGRFGHGAPLVEPLFPVKELPFAADVLGVNLKFLAVVGDAFPTDFCFGHD